MLFDLFESAQPYFLNIVLFYQSSQSNCLCLSVHLGVAISCSKHFPAALLNVLCHIWVYLAKFVSFFSLMLTLDNISFCYISLAFAHYCAETLGIVHEEKGKIDLVVLKCVENPLVPCSVAFSAWFSFPQFFSCSMWVFMFGNLTAGCYSLHHFSFPLP